MSQIDFTKFKDFIEVDDISTVQSKVDNGWKLFISNLFLLRLWVYCSGRETGVASGVENSTTTAQLRCLWEFELDLAFRYPNKILD